MKYSFSLFLIVLALTLASCTTGRQIDIYGTTDLHGMLLPFDNTEGTATDRSLSNVASLVESTGNKNIVLLDNGDILQGDPLAYYYNFVDTSKTHIVADILNYLGYDAATAGNHDIETGHNVYNRVISEYKFPMLAANAVDIKTGKPYFEPYTVIRKKDLKIIVFGLITPSVPNWLPESLYEGMRFEGMIETARKWMPVMKEENPDIIIGLFHSGFGREDDIENGENSSLAVAVNVPGFDIVMCGHDHNQENKTIINKEGSSVLILDGGSRASVLMHAKVSFPETSDGRVEKTITGELIPMDNLPESPAYNKRYNSVEETLKQYTSEVIGRSSVSITTRDAYFGPSAFVDLIHQIQLDITGADISFAAPLSFDEHISKGDILIRDMFRLYRFENFLYEVKMTGREVDKYLEHSYGLWLNTMESKDDYLLKYRTGENNEPQLYNGMVRMRNASYNFDSAMGINYIVDATKPEGNRVSISSLTGGAVFSDDSSYSVAVNSYRANGGGGHFDAAGITHSKLDSRIITATSRDLRFYMTEWIREKGEIDPSSLSSWKIIPEKWVSEAQTRETKLLFNDK
ncbi:MAG TPA: 5'-nucleotidase C-terminal domain-containing protein [Bacteroidales bacterium]|nr:5'-nucleotidase C-terminal domain-containing protein [Bacteroidales bacterium]